MLSLFELKNTKMKMTEKSNFCHVSFKYNLDKVRANISDKCETNFVEI